MYKFPIGVILSNFKKPYPEAIKLAGQLGMQGIQVYTTKGEMAPENMTPEKCREFLDMVKSEGLVVSALCGDIGIRFRGPQMIDNGTRLDPEYVERTKRILELAEKLETNIVTSHIGTVPEDSTHPRYKIMQEFCGTVAEHAVSQGARFAIETGPEKSSVLKGFLDSLHCEGIAVNLDPANLVMVAGDDPVLAVRNLKEYIVHTHAKDGIQNYRRNPEADYGGDTGEPKKGPAYKELPLGQGNVDFPKYLEALEAIGYRGFLTIEREVGSKPDEDIRLAVNYLRSIIG